MPDYAGLLLPSDAYDVVDNQIIGRRVAGRSMVQGFAKELLPGQSLPIICFSHQEKKKLQSLLQPLLSPGSSLSFHQLNTQVLESLGAIHVPDPGLTRWQLLRSGRPSNSFSITGVIHTLSSSDVFSEIERLCISSLHPWDALVCTSNAGKNVVESVFHNVHEHLQKRFDTKLPFPSGVQLPVIPLGCLDAFEGDSRTRKSRRAAARAELEIDYSSLVILFLGRLSFHSKAHPLPLYHALSRLTRDFPDRRIMLLECGHIYSDPIHSAFIELQDLFPYLCIKRLGGLTPATENQKKLALAAADVFVSMADNIQETFGLSVIEAMSASLPTIVSDWNGYKDLVENGVSGFLIPTEMVVDESGHHDHIDSNYALGTMSYDVMVGLRSMTTIVSHHALYRSLKLFLEFPDLSFQMGHLSRLRWKYFFSWQTVHQQYLQLWNELALLRRHHSDSSVDSIIPTPLFPSFSNYPSRAFNVFSIVRSDVDNCLPFSILRLKMHSSFVSTLMVDRVDHIISRFEQNSRLDIDDLLSLGIPESHLQSTLSVFVKLGLAIVEKRLA